MTESEWLLRILLSTLMGFVVGIERQWHHKQAGLKTNALVALGATTFALVSAHGFGPGGNPSMIAANVVTGIGFIGAGVIIRRGASIQGINSAATLWMTASLGLAIGAGLYRLAGILTLIVTGMQFLLRWIAGVIDRRSGLLPPRLSFRISVNFAASAAEAVRAVWSSFADQPGVAVAAYDESQSNAVERCMVARFSLPETRAPEAARLAQNVSAIPGAIRASMTQDATFHED